MGEVTSIGIHDKTGIKKNVTQILELLANKQLNCIVISWQTKGECEHVFWNGDNLKCRGLAAQALADMTVPIVDEIETEISYEESIGDPEEGDDAN